MAAFLSVTRGTSEPAKLLEIHYTGAPSKEAPPLAFVGKGITFDLGGISLKNADNTKLMRGDMGGTATVVALTPLAIAKLKFAVNLITIAPLTENMPEPGDIIYAMNGKTIEVDNTDAEGRLVLSDALYYASSEFNPHTLIDAATLHLWKDLKAAEEIEFDRFWMLPLDEEYGSAISKSNADLHNTGRPAGASAAVLFLKHFVRGLDELQVEGDEVIRWAHLDIASVMEVTEPTAYMEKGMTGRPVRCAKFVVVVKVIC
ncbi:Zn-dependent exopeptidase [Hymenopellis radicata]|nr:Zn-dependent exopeptidase [Hymenopellis radicata]